MGFACGSVAVPRSLATLYLQLHAFSHLKTILKIVVSRLLLPDNSLHRSSPERDHHDPQDRPPAWLVPLPPHLTVCESIKERLPMTRTSEFRVTDEDSASSPLCVVCMDGVDEEEEIRQLSNCRHVFHAGCLDRWIDNGHVTCPLCRSKLLHDNGGGKPDDRSCGSDPWRVERMVYLFGEDCDMGT